MTNNLKEFVSEIERDGTSTYGVANADQEKIFRPLLTKSRTYDALDKVDIEDAVKDYIRRNGFELQIVDNYLVAHTSIDGYKVTMHIATEEDMV